MRSIAALAILLAWTPVRADDDWADVEQELKRIGQDRVLQRLLRATGVNEIVLSETTVADAKEPMIGQHKVLLLTGRGLIVRSWWVNMPDQYDKLGQPSSLNAGGHTVDTRVRFRRIGIPTMSTRLVRAEWKDLTVGGLGQAIEKPRQFVRPKPGRLR